MKKITNWRNATVSDFEADDLLHGATKIHVQSYQMVAGEVKSIRGDNHERMKKFFQHHLDNNIPMVFHNGIGYDIPLMEKITGMDLSNLMVIDTLATSWYLSPERRVHGLDSFFEDYGIAKPPIVDWKGEGVDPEEFYLTMANRCQEDVKINKALWKDHIARLVDMYTISQDAINNGVLDEKTGDYLNVGGKRNSEDEWIPIDDMVGRSVEEAIDSILTFLMFKMDCARLQEKTRWKADVEHLHKTQAKLTAIVEEARDELESVMPLVPKYDKKTEPKSAPFKKNGDRNSHWVKWDEKMEFFKGKVKDEHGNFLVHNEDCEIGTYKVLNKYEEPSASSPLQVKAFLFSKGWVPKTFKYERDDAAFQAWIDSKPQGKANKHRWDAWKLSKPLDREIPQITVGGDDGKELCHSLLELAEEVPEIKKYAEYNVAKHRLSVIEGFLRDLEDGVYLKARIGGFTNTLRVQHRELVNLPGVDKPYGYDVRGSLIAGGGRILAGSDMSSLEDRVKHHFMLPHDPEYVATMQAPDFDPHILMALTAGMVTQVEFDEFKAGKKTPKVSKARKNGKVTNYASVYNAGPATIARAADVSLEVGEQLHEAYWKLNWAVKAIADEQVVVRCSRGLKWLINPVNGFMYSLRKDSDRFSTLAQGTGSFFFDMWVDNILTETYNRYQGKTLTGSFHDECILCIRDTPAFREEFANIIQESVEKVNKDYGLRRALGCDTQFGQRYSDIH